MDFHAQYARVDVPEHVDFAYLDYKGLRLPHGESFGWTDLLEVARGNGFLLSRDMLRKWRLWRLLPGPVAGGPTTAGPGKGQKWSYDAAWRVAWISRWHAAGVTYDALTLALWSGSEEMDGPGLKYVLDAVRGFVKYDYDVHVQVNATADRKSRRVLTAYESVFHFGDAEEPHVNVLLADAGVDPNSPPAANVKTFLSHTNLKSIAETAARTDLEQLARFIAAFRGSINNDPTKLNMFNLAFEESPTGLARSIVRELHRFRLVEDGII